MRTVITGANRGLGLELARRALARGDSVHAGVREPERAEALTALGAAAPGRLHVSALDVTREASVRAFAAALPGPVDLLLNNAGMRVRPDELEGMDFAALAQVRGERGVLVVVLSPGWVQTDMGGEEAPLTAQESAAGLLGVLERLGLQESGGFFDFRGERVAW